MTRGGKPLIKGEKAAVTQDGCCGPCGSGGGTGACCSSGVCSVESHDACNAAGGNYLGDGMTCGGVDCSDGGCCLSGSCSVETFSACFASGGSYLGDGTTCGSVDCSDGACCHANGSCSITTAFGCDNVYLGNGTTCPGVGCQGACCFEGGCEIATQFYCEHVLHGNFDGNPSCNACASGDSYFLCCGCPGVPGGGCCLEPSSNASCAAAGALPPTICPLGRCWTSGGSICDCVTHSAPDCACSLQNSDYCVHTLGGVWCDPCHGATSCP
jgi:hypothetical protein